MRARPLLCTRAYLTGIMRRPLGWLPVIARTELDRASRSPGTSGMMWYPGQRRFGGQAPGTASTREANDHRIVQVRDEIQLRSGWWRAIVTAC